MRQPPVTAVSEVVLVAGTQALQPLVSFSLAR